MNGSAKTVTGIDLDSDAVRYAKIRYINKSNSEFLNYQLQDACVPFTDKLFDVITSFETIEHVPHPDLMLDNIISMFHNDSTLIISSPVRQLGNLEDKPSNQHHLREWSIAEFILLLQQYFQEVEIYGQSWVIRDSWFHLPIPHKIQNIIMRKAGFDPANWQNFRYDVHPINIMPKWSITGPPQYAVAVCNAPHSGASKNILQSLCQT